MKNVFSQDLTSFRGRLHADVSLADYSSWRTGGTADYLYVPADLSDLASFLRALPSTIALTWLGLGSNTLIRDKGLAGIVVVTQGALSSLTATAASLEVRAEAGVASAQLARFAARLGMQGLEFMAGIPGTVGGALAMNAGCFGAETWEYVKQVETMNRAGEIRLRPVSDFQIGYRHVIKPAEEWFVAGHFSLQAGDRQQSLQRIRQLLKKRNSSQPTGTLNCGSVFRNPPGDFAGRIIEECGLKGMNIGGAKVSDKHANFIVNEHAATSADIEALITHVAEIVHEKTGVHLLPEVCIMGREG